MVRAGRQAFANWRSHRTGRFKLRKNTHLTIENFASLGLDPLLLKALETEGYTVPTPIQSQAIKPILEGRDLLGIAQTGTGKTAAFALPILQRLAANRKPPMRKGIRCLILSPTRELASQIGDSFRTYGRHMDLSVAVVYGGVGHKPQRSALDRGVDILVATPGRLIDHMTERNVSLEGTEILVLDEADQMMDLGFIRPLRQIVSKLSSRRQSLFFSATMPQEIGTLAAELLKDPVKVSVTPVAKTADRVEQKVIFVEQTRKRALLAEMFADPALSRTLVFTRTKRGADRVARHLEASGILCSAIHGNKSQVQRDMALGKFKSGKLRALIATDIAARGIDIDAVSHVINFEIPNVPEGYVHRIGRTARAGAEGIAISLVDQEEREYLRDIEKLTRQTIPSTDRRGDAGLAAATAEIASKVPAQMDSDGEPRRREDSNRKPRGDRGFGDKGRGDRGRGGKERGERPRSGAPRGDRPFSRHGDSPRGPRRDDLRPSDTHHSESRVNEPGKFDPLGVEPRVMVAEQTPSRFEARSDRPERRERSGEGRPNSFRKPRDGARDGHRGPPRNSDRRSDDNRRGEHRGSDARPEHRGEARPERRERTGEGRPNHFRKDGHAAPRGPRNDDRRPDDKRRSEHRGGEGQRTHRGADPRRDSERPQDRSEARSEPRADTRERHGHGRPQEHRGPHGDRHTHGDGNSHGNRHRQGSHRPAGGSSDGGRRDDRPANGPGNGRGNGLEKVGFLGSRGASKGGPRGQSKGPGGPGRTGPNDRLKARHRPE